jgi:hypothetical protein
MSKSQPTLPLRAHKKIWIVFLVMLTVFVLLTIANELLDLPHSLFGDEPTQFSHRKGEVIFEIGIYFLVIASSFWYFQKKLVKEIRILEGFIPICAKCKKIRQDVDWKTLEEYISANSLAKFSHSICPECLKILYPEFVGKPPKKKEAAP